MYIYISFSIYVYVYKQYYPSVQPLFTKKKERKKKEKKDRSFPCTFSLFTKRRITGYEMVDLA